MLSNNELAELIALAKTGDGEAKNRLIISNSPLIKSVLKGYIGKGVEYDDLYQLGALGFTKAIEKYDPSYGVKFTTYALPLILGEIKRFLRDDGAIKVSRSVKSLFVKIKKYLNATQDETERSVDKIAQHFGVSREEIVFAMEASHLPISLFEKTENSQGESLSLAEKIPCDNGDPVDLTDKIMITNLLKSLDERERKVMLLRYFRNATQSEVAKALNISQVQVSRIEQRVLAEFRETLKDEAI
ncbi:MAG: sigma-70 family RNA polymerase sigma factor [Christensenellaceae bacterium]|jgi:RNA polymerase sporulation-specific sigma factor|nr:sigma-70 family RNA polymerase sigma factor [Christensenellaceae bacterium]